MALEGLSLFEEGQVLHQSERRADDVRRGKRRLRGSAVPGSCWSMMFVRALQADDV